MNTQNTNIVVYDAMMSSGKTKRIIAEMLEEHKKAQYGLFGANKAKFIYISPFLSEAHRIAGTTARSDTDQRPKLTEQGKVEYLDVPQKELNFCHPSNQNKDGSKQTGLKHLIENGANIVSTHALFKELSPMNLEFAKDYTLVIDESLDVFTPDCTLTAKEVEQYIDINILSIGEDGHTIKFHRENFGRANKVCETVKDTTENTRYYEFAKACDKGLMFKNNGVVLRKFDAEILKAFKKVIIMTYNFKGSMFDLFLQQEKLEYTVEYFGKRVEDIKHLITINENYKDNAIGEIGIGRNGKRDNKVQFLTVTHYTKARNGNKTERSDVTQVMYNRLYNLWCQRNKVDASRRLWTCFKDDVMAISKGTGKTNRFSNSWIPFNTRATNDYDETDHLAFLVNVFMDNRFIAFTKTNGLATSQDHYALNILLQWLFRSAIRKDQPIDVFIPSERMRNLLKDWLDGKVITYNESKEGEDNE